MHFVIFEQQSSGATFNIEFVMHICRRVRLEGAGAGNTNGEDESGRYSKFAFDVFI